MALRRKFLLVVPAALLAAGAAAGLVAGCATRGGLPALPEGGPFWPAPPQQARVAYVGSFRSASEIGIRPGLGGRLLEFIAGSDLVPMDKPYAVAVHGDMEGTGPGGGRSKGPARIAVADTGARGIHLFDLRNGAARLVVDAGEGGTLCSPVAVAFDAAGRLLVCDSVLGRLLRYAPDGTFDAVLSVHLGRPAGLAVDAARGRIYVADATGHSVRTLDLEGKPLGDVAVGFRFPAHLSLDREGNLLVSDSMNFRVVVVSPEGKVAATAGKLGDASGDLQRPKGVASDSDGHLFVADALFDNLQVFDREGALLLAVGSSGDQPGEFALPAGIFIDERDFLWVADTYNGRVQVFRYLGGEER